MTATNPPGWLQNAGDTHPAAPMRSFIGGLMGVASAANSLVPAGGVNPQLGEKLVVEQTGSPSLAVVVASGIAWIPGTLSGTQGVYGFMNDADVTLSLTTAHVSLARIDIVVATVRDSQYTGSDNDCLLQVIAGTPASSPAAPANPANSLRLAEVLVGAGVVSVTNANITDRRTWLGAVTGSLVPDVQSIGISGNWTKPNGGRFTWVRCWGGGGAGGGAGTTAAGQASVGGGGQAGGYAERYFDTTTLSLTEAVVIGTAGAGAAGAAGGNGGNTTFSSSGNLVQGGGGNGGAFAPANANYGATDQSAVTQTNTGTITGRGAPGTPGIRNSPDGDGRGGAGGSTSLGGGAGTGVVNANGAAGAANTGGGGAGGANNASQGVTRTGGAGGTGLVIAITYF